MKKIIIMFVSGAWLILMGGCSKKEGPNPEDTSLIKSDGRGTFQAGAGSDGFAEDEDIAGGGILIDNNLNDGLALQDDSWASPDALVGADPNRFSPILFGFDQYNVARGERSKLQQVAEYLQVNRDARIMIEGHCDWKGTPAYNKALGDRRATSVKNYLIDLGAEEIRIDVRSMGDEYATPNANTSTAGQERKAQFFVLD